MFGFINCCPKIKIKKKRKDAKFILNEREVLSYTPSSLLSLTAFSTSLLS